MRLFLIGDVDEVNALNCRKVLNGSWMLEPTMIDAFQATRSLAKIVLCDAMQVPSRDTPRFEGLLECMMSPPNSSVGPEHAASDEHHLPSHSATKGWPLLKMSCYEGVLE